MQKGRLFIGVDIGGTSIVAARFSESEMFEWADIPTGADRSAEEIMESLFQVIRRVMSEEVVGIGIGIPGYMDAGTGEVLFINNIPSFNGFSVKQAVEKEFKLPTFQNNDANCFALGEAWYGAGKPFKHMVGITLGTGMGGGIIIDRKVYSGLAGGAGEVGCFEFRGAMAEKSCAAAFFEDNYQTNGAELYKKATQNDREALRIFEEAGHNIGDMIRILMFILAPEAIVIGGSISGAWEFMEKAIRQKMNEFPVEIIARDTRLVRAELSNAGLYGAAALCISQMDQS